jgi:5'-AMP-activated protein kinase catalytic alpha subunit
LSESEALKFFQEIIDAVEYLHSQNIVHRDLKPENLLLDYKLSIKVSDFGLSTTYTADNLLTTPCGTPSYAPPEMLRGEDYHGLLSDIWSCGVILYAMLCGYLPFSESNEELNCQKIIQGEYEMADWMSEGAIDLIQHILRVDPLDRYDIDQIKEHPWFNSNAPRMSPGLVIGYHKIPIDERILDEVEKYGYNREKAKISLENNKFDVMTSIYYLAVRKFIKEGGSCISDLQSQEFLDYIKDEKNIIHKEEQKEVITIEHKEVITIEHKETKENLPENEINSDQKVEESVEYNPNSANNIKERISMKLAGRRSIVQVNILDLQEIQEHIINKQHINQNQNTNPNDKTKRNSILATFKRKSIATSSLELEKERELFLKYNNNPRKSVQIDLNSHFYKNNVVDTISNVAAQENIKENEESFSHESESSTIKNENSNGNPNEVNLIQTLNSEYSLGKIRYNTKSSKEANKIDRPAKKSIKNTNEIVNDLEIKQRKKSSTIASKSTSNTNKLSTKKISKNYSYNKNRKRINNRSNTPTTPVKTRKETHKNKFIASNKIDTSAEKSYSKIPNRNISYSPNECLKPKDKRVEVVPWNLNKKMIDNPDAEVRNKIISDYQKFKQNVNSPNKLKNKTQKNDNNGLKLNVIKYKKTKNSSNKLASSTASSELHLNKNYNHNNTRIKTPIKNKISNGNNHYNTHKKGVKKVISLVIPNSHKNTDSKIKKINTDVSKQYEASSTLISKDTFILSKSINSSIVLSLEKRNPILEYYIFRKHSPYPIINRKIFDIEDKNFEHIKVHQGPVDFKCIVTNFEGNIVQSTIAIIKNKKIIFIQTNPYKLRCSKTGLSFDIEIFKLEELPNSFYFKFRLSQGEIQNLRKLSQTILAILNNK